MGTTTPTRTWLTMTLRSLSRLSSWTCRRPRRQGEALFSQVGFSPTLSTTTRGNEVAGVRLGWTTSMRWSGGLVQDVARCGWGVSGGVTGKDREGSCWERVRRAFGGSLAVCSSGACCPSRAPSHSPPPPFPEACRLQAMVDLRRCPPDLRRRHLA